MRFGNFKDNEAVTMADNHITSLYLAEACHFERSSNMEKVLYHLVSRMKASSPDNTDSF